jgi:hypothetical protein
MEYAFEITKLSGERRLIKACSLQDIIRRKNNYRRSPFFKGSHFSRIFSQRDSVGFSLGDMANLRWRK